MASNKFQTNYLSIKEKLIEERNEFLRQQKTKGELVECGNKMKNTYIKRKKDTLKTNKNKIKMT